MTSFVFSMTRSDFLFLFRRARWDFESCNSDYVVHDRAARADIRSRAFCHVELIWVLILR